MSFARSIHAETIKLKYLPIFWLVGVVVFTVLAVIFSAHFIDVNAVATLGGNPWLKIFTAGRGIFSVFISVPFVVLLISAALNVEHQAHAWKYQYTLPMRRSHVFYAKLATLVLAIALTMFILSIGLILCGYLLDAFLPEMEFRYYRPSFFDFLKGLAHTFIALLGIIGIQYFLSLRFKSFLIPASFGIVAYIVGLILGSINNPLAKFFPYSYPVIVKDVKMFRREGIGIIEYEWLNNIEIYSVICFLVCVGLANLLEERRDVV